MHSATPTGVRSTSLLLFGLICIALAGCPQASDTETSSYIESQVPSSDSGDSNSDVADPGKQASGANSSSNIPTSKFEYTPPKVELPDDFPSDIYFGEELVADAVIPNTSNGVLTVSFKMPGFSLSKGAEIVSQEMTKLDWTISANRMRENGGNIEFSKGDRRVTYSLVPGFSADGSRDATGTIELPWGK